MAVWPFTMTQKQTKYPPGDVYFLHHEANSTADQNLESVITIMVRWQQYSINKNKLVKTMRIIFFLEGKNTNENRLKKRQP